jgi:hypothetical protein
MKAIVQSHSAGLHVQKGRYLQMKSKLGGTGNKDK